MGGGGEVGVRGPGGSSEVHRGGEVGGEVEISLSPCRADQFRRQLWWAVGDFLASPTQIRLSGRASPRANRCTRGFAAEQFGGYVRRKGASL